MRRIGVISDVHCGSVVGLWPGKHAIEGGGTYEANKGQQWLWQCWKNAAKDLRKCDTIVLNGDAIQGVNKRDGQLIGSTTQCQVDAALDMLKPVITGRVYCIRGTEWHDGQAAESMEQLAQRLGAVPDPETGQSSRWQLLLDVGGPVIDFGHAIGVSTVVTNEAMVPLRDAVLEMAELARVYRATAPNVSLVVRSHRHRYVHVEVPGLQALVTPGWQLRTAYSWKVGGFKSLPEIGWVLIEWDGKDLMVKDRTYRLPPLSVETYAD